MKRSRISKTKISSTGQRADSKLVLKTNMSSTIKGTTNNTNVSAKLAKTSRSSSLIGDIPIERKLGMTNLCAAKNSVKLKEISNKNEECDEELRGQHDAHKNSTHYHQTSVDSKKSIEDASCELNAENASTNNFLESTSKALTRTDFQKKFGSNALNAGLFEKQRQRPSSTTTKRPVAKTSTTLGMKGVQSMCVPSKKSMPYLKTNTSSCLNSVHIGNYSQKPTTQALSKTAYSLKTQQSKSASSHKKTTTTTSKAPLNTNSTKSKLATENFANTKVIKEVEGTSAASGRKVELNRKVAKSDAHQLQTQLELSASQKNTHKTGAMKKSTTITTEAKGDSCAKANNNSNRLMADSSTKLITRTTTTSAKTSSFGRTIKRKSVVDSNRTFMLSKNKAPDTTTGSKNVNLQIVSAAPMPRLEGGGVTTLSKNLTKPQNQHSISINEFASSSTIETGEPSSDFLNTLWLSDSTSFESFPIISSISMQSQSLTSGESIIGYKNPHFRRSSSTSNEIFSIKEAKIVDLIQTEVKLTLKEQPLTKQKPNSSCKTQKHRKINKSKAYLQSLIPPNDQDVAKYNKMKIQQRRNAIWKEWVGIKLV